MNLHQKAKKIRREICNAVFADGVSSGDMESVGHNILVKALQEVRRETLRECELLAREFYLDYKIDVKRTKGHIQSGYMGSLDTAKAIEEAIRSKLKE